MRIPRVSFDTSEVPIRKFLDYLIAGKLAEGQDIHDFEAKFSQLIGVKYGICTISARSGLYLILRSLCLKKDDEIIVSSFNYSIIAELIGLFATPVFADISISTLNTETKDIISCITGKTKAILVTHMEGMPADMEKVMQIARKKEIFVIEDCAHATFASYKTRYAGSFGDASIFSFGLGKQVNTYGGGIIMTNSRNLERYLRRELMKFDHQGLLSIISKEIRFRIVSFFSRGFIYSTITYPFILLSSKLKLNIVSRMFEDERHLKQIPGNFHVRYSNYQAALALTQMKRIKKNIADRQKNARLLLSLLNNNIKHQEEAPGINSSWLHFTILSEDRDALIDELLRQGIDAQPGWMKLCHDINSPGKQQKFRNAAFAGSAAVYIPMYPDLTNEKIYYMAKVLNSLYETRSGQSKLPEQEKKA